MFIILGRVDHFAGFLAGYKFGRKKDTLLLTSE